MHEAANVLLITVMLKSQCFCVPAHPVIHCRAVWLFCALQNSHIFFQFCLNKCKCR